MKSIYKNIEKLEYDDQWESYDKAPVYDGNEIDMEEPLGAAKFFHKTIYGITKVDKSFFEHFIITKRFDKFKNLIEFFDYCTDTENDSSNIYYYYLNKSLNILGCKSLLDFCVSDLNVNTKVENKDDIAWLKKHTDTIVKT